MINPFYIPIFAIIVENNIEYEVTLDFDLYDEQWRRADNRHLSRELGPAITQKDGKQYWWHDDAQVECSSQEEFAKKIKLKVFW